VRSGGMLAAVVALIIACVPGCAGGGSDAASPGARGDARQPEPLPPSRTRATPPAGPAQTPDNSPKPAPSTDLGDIYCFVGVGGSTDKVEHNRLPDVLVHGGWAAWSREVAPQVDRFYGGYRGRRKQCIVHTPFGFTTGDMKFQMWTMARDNPRLAKVAGAQAFEPFKTAMSRLANLSTDRPWIYFGTAERDPFWGDEVRANLNPRIDTEVQWARAVTDHLVIDSSSDEDEASVCWYIAKRLQQSGATIGYEGWPVRNTPWPAQADMTCFVWTNQIELIEQQKPAWPATRDEVKGRIIVVDVDSPREDTIDRCARYLVDYGNVAFPPWHPGITAEKIRARAAQLLIERQRSSQSGLLKPDEVAAGAVGGGEADSDSVQSATNEPGQQAGQQSGQPDANGDDSGELLRRYVDPGRPYPAPAMAPQGELAESPAHSRTELQALARESSKRIVIENAISLAGEIVIEGNDVEIAGRGGGKLVHAGSPGSGSPKDPRDVLITIGSAARRVVIRDLTIECNGHSAIRIMGRPHDITLDNVIIRNAWFGIDASQGRATRLLARNVDFGRFGKYGYFGGGEQIILAGCTFRGSEFEHLMRLYDMQELLIYKCLMDYETVDQGLTKSAIWMACVSGASIIGCDSRNGRWIVGPNDRLDDGCMTDSVRLLGNRIQLRPGQTFSPIQLNRGAGHVVVRDNTIVRVKEDSRPVVRQQDGHETKPPCTFDETGTTIVEYAADTANTREP
jgi:hypothetical protein